MPEHFDLAAYREVHAHGDTPEDSHLLALAQRKFYRGEEVNVAT